MSEWNLLTNHARVLLCIARDGEVRLRDIAGALNLTERRVFGIVSDLTEAGWVVKEKIGRRNRYLIQSDVRLSELATGEVTLGKVLKVLIDSPIA